MPEKARTQKPSSPAARPSRSSAGVGPREAARTACACLEGLISHPLEGVSAVHRTEGGWRVCVDVVEVPRIPDTTSLLATYEVTLDRQGVLTEYRRVRRYNRGAVDE